MPIDELSASTPTGLELKVQDALQGVQQVLPAKGGLKINNGVMTQAQLIAQLNGYLTTFEAVDTAKATYAEAVAARKAVEPAVRESLVQLRAALVACFGRGSMQLARFGMSAPKPTRQNPTTAVLAAAQRTLTRAQRGTMSKKKRTSITVVSPPQITLGGSGKPVVLPPTINVSSTAAAGDSATASGQVPAVVAPPAPLGK